MALGTTLGGFWGPRTPKVELSSRRDAQNAKVAFLVPGRHFMDFGGENGIKKAYTNQLFLVIFLEGSGSLSLVARGPRKPHFRQRIPAAAPYSKITILPL